MDEGSEPNIPLPRLLIPPTVYMETLRALASWPECALADQGAHVMTIQTAPGAVTARALASHTNAPEADLTGLGTQQSQQNQPIMPRT